MKNIKAILFPSLIATILIVILDLLTNSLNTQTNQWDFIYYIAMAKDGFSAENLASPFAYRYITTAIVYLLTNSGLSIEHGFRLVAYIGAFSQLLGIYLFIHWLTQSNRAAWLSMVVTAFSIYNIKFLLFDIYRPDHLAYALILIQTYFALEKKFIPLLLLTLIGSQLREFNLIPLFAYLFMLAKEKRDANFFKQLGLSLIFILPAIILPRLLIPVNEDYQIVGLSLEKLLNIIVLPLIPSVSINFIFSVFAYVLPLFLITSTQKIKSTFTKLKPEIKNYLIAYTFFVLMLSFFGGTDFTRFATFLFLPQIIFIGLLADELSNQKIIFVLICMFIFNRLWVHFPDWDVQAYRSFYGGFSLVLNSQTWLRILELSAFLVIGYFINRKTKVA